MFLVRFVYCGEKEFKICPGKLFVVYWPGKDYTDGNG